MMKETLSQTDLLGLPLFAFLLFLTTFVFVVVRVIARGRKDAHLEAAARLPLDDDSETRRGEDAP